MADTKFTPVSLTPNEDKPLYRYFRVKAKDAEDDSTFQVRMSSEYPGEQRATEDEEKLGIAKRGEKYVEILSHEAGDVDLSRFTGDNRAPLLDEHKDNRHLGYVKTAALSNDKALRGVIVFDKVSKLSKTRCAEVKADSRVNFSLGYVHTGYLGTQTLDDGATGHRFSFRAVELSNVACPLDPSAQKGRSNKDCHCIRCGDIYDRSELDDNFMCKDCAAAEDPGDAEERKAGERMFRVKSKDNEDRDFRISHRELDYKVKAALHSDKRFKKEDDAGNKNSSFHHHDTHQTSADGSAFQAIVQHPAWSNDSKYYAVDFNFDGKDVELGEHTEVEPKQTWEAVERGLPFDARTFRMDEVMDEDGTCKRGKDSKKPYGEVEYADPGYQKDGVHRYPVDTKAHAKAALAYASMPKNKAKYSAADYEKVMSKIKAACKKLGVEVSDERSQTADLTRSQVDLPKITNDAPIVPQILTRSKIMTPEEIKAALTPEIVTDSLDNVHVRAAIEKKGYIAKTEVEAAAKTKTEKLAARNKEIEALEKENCRDFGTRICFRSIADGKKEAQYLRDGIHIAAMECMAMDDSKPDTEVRQIFRSKVDDLKRDSVSEENVKKAANDAETGLAGQCDDMFGTIRRTLERAHKDGIVSNGLMPDGAEKEYTEEMKKFYRNMPGSARIADLGGFAVPPSKGRAIRGATARRLPSRMTRDALAMDFATAGAMIAPEFRPYIELLRNKIVLTNLGCTYLGGCAGEQVFPRQEAATVAQSVAEGTALLTYDQTLGQIKMSPHRVGSRQYYSRLALIQAPPDFESMVWNDHSKVLAIYVDEMGLAGTGNADQPVGVLNQPGIAQLIFGGTPTYQSILNFRTNIRKFNVDGPLSFVTTSVGQGRLAYLPAALNGSTVITQGELDALWKGDEIDGEMLGCKAIASQQIPGDILLAGVFEELILASWGGIFTILDNYTRAANDEVAITFNTYFDVAVRHAQAFCRSLDSANQ